MTWQTFVKDLLMGAGQAPNVLRASAIIGKDYLVWADSADFPKFAFDELTAIIEEFKSPGTLATTGFSFGGIKYVFEQQDDNSVIRGVTDLGCIIIKKTLKAFVVGLYDDPTDPNTCDEIVKSLGVYMIEHEY